MKKIIVYLLMILLMTGCSNSSSVYNTKLQRYNAYYTTILNNDAFQAGSDHFDISSVISKLSETQYRYDVYVDGPRIAMYDVQIMVIENNQTLEISKSMMPTVGIFDDIEYDLIPYQVNMSEGYVKGFNLNAVVANPSVSLKVLVVWKDYAKVNQYREYFSFSLDFNQQVNS